MLVVTGQVHRLEALELLDVQRLAHLLLILEPASACGGIHQVHEEPARTIQTIHDEISELANVNGRQVPQ
jgi:hypothetical protein